MQPRFNEQPITHREPISNHRPRCNVLIAASKPFNVIGYILSLIAVRVNVADGVICQCRWIARNRTYYFKARPDKVFVVPAAVDDIWFGQHVASSSTMTKFARSAFEVEQGSRMNTPLKRLVPMELKAGGGEEEVVAAAT